MNIPKWFELLVKGWHISLDGFADYMKAQAERTSVPQELIDAAYQWFEKNISDKVTADVVFSGVTTLVLEIQSGRPGMDPDHAGLL